MKIFQAASRRPLNGLQLLTVFLRIAHDLALGEAVDPQSREECCGVRGECRRHPDSEAGGTFLGRTLLPAAAGSHVEDPDVTPGQQLKGSLNLVHANRTEWSPSVRKLSKP